ncbi:MAG: TetR/AcrR family transcriptional regulator [Betaproteobacteria bacterium]
MSKAALRELPEDADQKTLRGRPRSMECHGAILDSVLQLMQQEGYNAVTIEGVARHAGVGKQTIYRWWGSRAELILEAFANHAADLVPTPDRGSLREDLEVFISAGFKRLFKGYGEIMRGLMADAILDPEFNKILREAFILRRRAATKEILKRGIQRGEIAKDTDMDLMIDMLFGPVWFRLLVQHAKLDATFARQIIDAVLTAFAPPVKNGKR